MKRSKNDNIRFLLGTITGAPAYKLLIDYPDSNGVRHKVNEYNEPLPYDMEKPEGVLFLDVASEECKNSLISLRFNLNNPEQAEVAKNKPTSDMSREEIEAEIERIERIRCDR